jgi:hypothetical protein
MAEARRDHKTRLATRISENNDLVVCPIQRKKNTSQYSKQATRTSAGNNKKDHEPSTVTTYLSIGQNGARLRHHDAANVKAKKTVSYESMVPQARWINQVRGNSLQSRSK